MAARSVSDKILAIVFPVAGFVAMGFEHCIANLFFLPYAWLLAPISATAIVYNLALVVTLGNVIGGTLLVAGVYSLAYRSPARKGTAP